ncbi:hypothetical protein TSUD_91330 [Trifolium subterraneum]|uniref:Uncharacterized protein n=1 Tax=Trifolium subterraneum TaxID=3900 RepID=A0A2Z6P6V4_TRISU|nr:hypothetical protein TSUD_91330 [Trifolium subterraneum]
MPPAFILIQDLTAAVHRGFGRQLPYHQVTNFLNLPALGEPYGGWKERRPHLLVDGVSESNLSRTTSGSNFTTSESNLEVGVSFRFGVVNEVTLSS